MGTDIDIPAVLIHKFAITPELALVRAREEDGLDC